jgi:hypothetical protein
VPVKGAEEVEFCALVEAAVSVSEEVKVLLAAELALPVVLVEALPGRTTAV